MKPIVSKTNFKNQLTIALYRDGKKWVCHNLTLDIVGVGASKKIARNEMRALTEHQFQFAISNNMPQAINHAAPERFWKMVAEKINTEIIGQLIKRSGALRGGELRHLLKFSPVYDLSASGRIA